MHAITYEWYVFLMIKINVNDKITRGSPNTEYNAIHFECKIYSYTVYAINEGNKIQPNVPTGWFSSDL
jgi:hypothetical protein